MTMRQLVAVSCIIIAVALFLADKLVPSKTSVNHGAAKAFAAGRLNHCLELLTYAESPHDLLLRAKANIAKATMIHLENEKEPIIQYLEIAAKDCNRIADELFDHATEQQRAEAAAVKRIATKQLAIYRP